MSFREYLPLYKKNLLLAGPVVLSQIGIVTVSLADNMMVGHVGTIDLAAASFATNVFHLGLLFGMGVCMGLTPLVGKVYSQRNESELGSYLKNGFFIQLLFSLLVILLMACLSLFFYRMGQPVEVIDRALPYYLVLVSSMLPLLFFYTFKQFLEGVGNTSLAMTVTLLSNLINIILNYILIFGKLGAPAMGLMGAGWASLIARLCMPLMLVPLFIRRRKYAKLVSDAFKAAISVARMKEILFLGLPIGLQLIVEVIVFSAGAVMMGWLGKDALAGHQVAISLATFTYMISLGIGSGTTINVSHEYGVGNYEGIKKSVFASLHLVVSFMAIMAFLFILLRNQLPYLFTNDVDVIGIASALLIVAALFQVFDGIQVVLLGTLRGLADVTVPMFIAFISYSVVGLSVSYCLGFFLNFGPVGVWMGFLFGLVLAAVLFFLRLFKIYRNH